jgi:hypothetical protein
MTPDERRDLATRAELLSSQMKRVEREARIAKQMAAQLRDRLQLPEEEHKDGPEEDRRKLEVAQAA